MRALSEMQRNYVLAQGADPFGNPTRWARKAGFSEASKGALRVTAHRLAHDVRVQAAVMEFARGTLSAVGPILATSAMLRVAANPKHPKHLRAAEMLANRVGLHETTEHVVNVNHSDRTGAAMAERIKQMAGVLGIDPGQLLGVNAGPAPMLIEGEVANEKASD